MTIVLAALTVLGLAGAGSGQASDHRPPSIESTDPALDAYTTFVEGKKLKTPVDQVFIIAALDRLASAVEGLALREGDLGKDVLSAAQQVRRDIRLLQPRAPSTASRLKRRWTVFADAAALIDGLGREIDPRGVGRQLRASVLRAADSLDYDDPLRWQPDALEAFFDLAARALKQMAAGSIDRLVR